MVNYTNMKAWRRTETFRSSRESHKETLVQKMMTFWIREVLLRFDIGRVASYQAVGWNTGTMDLYHHQSYHTCTTSTSKYTTDERHISMGWIPQNLH